MGPFSSTKFFSCRVSAAGISQNPHCHDAFHSSPSGGEPTLRGRDWECISLLDRVFGHALPGLVATGGASLRANSRGASLFATLSKVALPLKWAWFLERSMRYAKPVPHTDEAALLGGAVPSRAAVLVVALVEGGFTRRPFLPHAINIGRSWTTSLFRSWGSERTYEDSRKYKKNQIPNAYFDVLFYRKMRNDVLNNALMQNARHR